ncbi:dephospho-CoA kinase [Marinilabilia sp.]|uniref:dephospho-CoA kinase n=1 Tax=Marinilabilia sp. TaxID=2021252 RepID=UPI0025BE9789|nr:dephospho-CoA kinase [Marinilabilia sp.]
MKVGVTGGIGSGKTTVCRIFESLGIPVYYADVRAKDLVLEEPLLKTGYIKLFGKNVFSNNGRLNRQLVAGNIFNDRMLLKEVNKLVHPFVRRDFEKWCQKQTAPYVIEEAAVLIESEGYKFVDNVVLVTAPDEIRIERVMTRDQHSREKVMERINNQWKQEKLREFSDFEVRADDVQLVIPQVLEIHKELLK